MHERVVMQILTPREDGCIVNIRPNADGTLYVRLISSFDQASVVDENKRLPKAELYDWIDSRQDW